MKSPCSSKSNGVKRIDYSLLENYAFRMMAVILPLTWGAAQMLLFGEVCCLQDARQAATNFLLSAVVMLLYSLKLVLRMKRLKSYPAREPTQLFFGLYLLILPFLAWEARRHLLSLARCYDSFDPVQAATVPIIYASAIFSTVYFVAIVIWLRFSVRAYPGASKRSWFYRLSRFLRSVIVDPYSNYLDVSE